MIQWKECSINDATHIEINGVVHEIVYGGKVLKSGKSSIDGKYLCISILSMYNWMQIPQEAFPFLGIKPLRKVKRKPIESGIQVKKDGNQWCATQADFINLQESPAGFGDSPKEAIEALLLEVQN
jgi:hypothetical protein